MKQTYNVLNIIPGTVLPGNLQWISAFSIQGSGEKPVSLVIPGEILRCGTATLLRVLPHMVLEFEGETLLLSPAVTADARMDAELNAIRKALGSKAPEKFAIRLNLQRPASLFNGTAEMASCGCGSSKVFTSAHVEVGISPGAGPLKWSRAVRARVMARPITEPAFSNEDDGCWVWWDCRSDWTYEWSLSRRRTNCVGPCAATTDCKCEQTSGWYRKSCVHSWTYCTCV